MTIIFEDIDMLPNNTQQEGGSSSIIRFDNIPFKVNSKEGRMVRLGLIVLDSNNTIEQDFMQTIVKFPGVVFYVTRIPFAPCGPEVTVNSLAATANSITNYTALLLPKEPFNAIAYGCTSATSILGEERLGQLIHAAKPEAHAINPITASIAALRAFGAKRIGILTPYIGEVNVHIEETFKKAGFDIAVFGSFKDPRDTQTGDIVPASIRAAVRQVADAGKMDAIFISCTNLRALEVIEQSQADTGLPITSSNQALLWHSLRLAGVRENPGGLGRLFELQI